MISDYIPDDHIKRLDLATLYTGVHGTSVLYLTNMAEFGLMDRQYRLQQKQTYTHNKYKLKTYLAITPWFYF